MFINPKSLIDKGYITGIRDPEVQIQPNAIDFTLDSLSKVTNSVCHLSETTKKMRPHVKKVAIQGTWSLDANTVYDGSSDVYVEVPEGMAAVLYTRSTFARNGIFIMSGLYDSGFKGHIGFTIYTLGGPAIIGTGTRIGQIAFMTADAAKAYAGGYNTEQGQHWTESQKQG